MELAWVGTPLMLVYMLAAFRITRLLLTDSLPPLPAMRTWVRDWLNGRRGWTVAKALRAGRELTAMEMAREHHMVKLLTCAWCSGFWVSAVAVAAASSPAEPYLRPLAVILAFSAVVGILAGGDEK